MRVAYNDALDAGDPFDFYGVKRAFTTEKYETYDWCKHYDAVSSTESQNGRGDAVRPSHLMPNPNPPVLRSSDNEYTD